MSTIAEPVVHNLATHGIQRIWGVPGDSLNAVTEAIRREKGIEWVLTRHEEEAAFAAAGEAALTGELAVCAGSCGPGNMHLINGLHDAHRSRVPVLAIASHIPSDEIGSQYFQETRPTELFRDCTVFCEMVLSRPATRISGASGPLVKPRPGDGVEAAPTTERQSCDRPVRRSAWSIRLG